MTFLTYITGAVPSFQFYIYILRDVLRYHLFLDSLWPWELRIIVEPISYL